MNQVLSTHIPLVRSMSIPVNALHTLSQGHILQIGDPPALKSSSCDDIQFGWHGCSGSIDYPYLNIKYGSDPSARVCRSRRLFLSRRTVARCRRMPRLIAGAAQPFTDNAGETLPVRRLVRYLTGASKTEIRQSPIASSPHLKPLYSISPPANNCF